MMKSGLIYSSLIEGIKRELSGLDDLFENFSERFPFRLVEVKKQSSKEGVDTYQLPFAGIPKENISVSLQGNYLTIEGKLEDEVKKLSQKYAFSLPTGVKGSDISATYKDGMLDVSYKAPQIEGPKKEEKEKISIPIK